MICAVRHPPEPSGELARGGPSPARRLAESLRGAVPIVRRVAREAARLAVLAAAGGVVIWVLRASRLEAGPGRLGRLILAAILLAVPPAILLLVAFALRQLAAIPDRLAALPDQARWHVSEIGRLAQEAGKVRQRGWFGSAFAVLRLWRTTAETRGLVEGAVPVAFLFSPWTWVVAPLAAAAAMLEIVAGAVALFWLVLG
jgi:hypothetical protein